MTTINHVYELNGRIDLVRVTEGTAVCWASDKIIEENEIVIGINHSGDKTRLLHPLAISTLENNLQTPKESKFLTLIKNTDYILCKRDCIVCGENAEDNEELIYLSGVFGGILDPWVHTDCTDDCMDLLAESVEDYHPEIVGHSI